MVDSLNRQDSGFYRVPELDAPEAHVLDFKRKHFNFYSVLRNRQMERMARNLLYTYGRQWIELDSEIILAGSRGYVFRDKKTNPDYQLPRPTTNYIAPAVELEVASLGKRELVPNIISRSNDPRIEAAAKAAKEILQYRLEKLDWPAARELVTFLTVTCGTGIIKTFWDETYSDMTLIGSPDAVACPSCGLQLSSPKIDPTMLGNLQGPLHNIGSAKESVKPDGMPQLELQHCPTCESPVPLEPGGIDEEAASGADMFGRPNGVYIPKGNTNIEVVSPFDLFPENSGIEVTPETCRVWGQATVRSLDYIEERWPDRMDEIHAEDPGELMRNHSILGDWNLIGRFHSALDSNIYDNHARLYEIHVKPGYRFPNGRRIIIANDTILENGEGIKTVPLPDGTTASAPWATYSAARFKTRHKEFWGQALVDDLISPQNRINGMDSQVIDARERTGSPNILVPEDCNLTGPSWREDYGSGKFLYYTPSVLNPGQSKPEVFGSTLFPIGVYQERDRIISDMKAIAGPQDIEVGEAPKNVTTTSGLQLLGEAAERKRGTRERAIVQMFEGCWEATLKLIWTFRADTDEYETKNAEGRWEVKQYTREAILGQTKVKVEKQAYIDKSLYQKEAAREAQADGLYQLTSQASIKRLLELRNLPTDINEDLNRQVDIAKQQWTDFVDFGTIPVIDKSIDDFRIRFQVLATFLVMDEGKDLEKKYGWQKTIVALAGWEDKLAQLRMQEQQVEAWYGGRIPQDQANAMYAQMTAAYQQQMASYQTLLGSAGQAGVDPNTGMAPQLPPPPQQPPPPVFLPAYLPALIYMAWQQMLQEAAQSGQGAPPQAVSDPSQGLQGQDPQAMAAASDAFLKFRAVVDAYKILADEKDAAMMAPPPPAPGTEGGTPGVGGATPGLDSVHPNAGNSPPTPPVPAPAPGVRVNTA